MKHQQEVTKYTDEHSAFLRDLWLHFRTNSVNDFYSFLTCLQHSFTFETECSNILEIQNTNYPAWL